MNRLSYKNFKIDHAVFSELLDFPELRDPDLAVVGLFVSKSLKNE